MAKKLLFIFGTRPEAIKIAPVYLRFLEDKTFDVHICVTAQHREMLDQVMLFFDIKANYDLNLMKANQTLNTLFASVVSGLENIFAQHHYDGVFVHGDTTTSSAAALSAFHRSIPVFHIEAGLRTFNIKSPWPEEMNRRITSVLSSYHFSPTQKSRDNLLQEKIPLSKVLVTGNTVVDALIRTEKIIEADDSILRSLENHFNFLRNDKKLILVTGHRREHFGKKFEAVCQALKALSSREDVQIVYPVHLNPNVRGPVHKILNDNPNIFLTEPLSYPEFVYLMKKSYLILTDSGGIQEEAPTFHKPVLVMRDNTERPEAVGLGCAKLVGTNTENIVRETTKLLDSHAEYKNMQKSENPYGDGNASEKILAFTKLLFSEEGSHL